MAKKVKGQGVLIDTVHPMHKELAKAANRYADARDTRMAAMRPEKEAKAELIDKMHDAKLEKYVVDDEVTIELVPGKTGIKVRVTKDEDDLEELEAQDKAEAAA